MTDTRTRLPLGSKLDGRFTVVEYLKDYDSDSSLVYKVSKLDAEHNYYIVSEYYPITGCLRNADGSLSIEENLIEKQQFDKGRALFFKAYLDMYKPEGEQRFGRPVGYQMFNETA